MDTENCPEYLFLSMESFSSPSTNTTFDGGCSDPCSLVILDSQVDAEAYSAGFRSSLHPTVLAIDTAAETPHPEIPIFASGIHYEDLLPTCPLETDTMCQTTMSSFMSNIFAEADTNCNRGQGGMTLSYNYSQPIDVQYQERASTDILQQSRNLGNCPTAASSRSPGKPSKERFRCSDCKRDYSQRQGVRRHFREAHEDSFCPHCKFKWHRHHQLKEHLEEQHPDIHHRKTLRETTRCRRMATAIKKLPRGTTGFPSRYWIRSTEEVSTPAAATDVAFTYSA